MKERNWGLDICRILSMIGIVLLHVIGRGGVLSGEKDIGYWAARWIHICAMCSVDIFAIMSGYFGINKKKATVYRAVELESIVLFYSAIITVCFLVFAPDKISGAKDILHGLLPPLMGRYWYITCFLPVLVFQPFLNKMLLSLTEKQHLAMVLAEVIIFSCIPSFFTVDFFRLEDGYSFVWLLVLYSIGAYLARTKEDPLLKDLKRHGFLLFFICSAVLLLGNAFIFKIRSVNMNYMVSYTSPIVLAMGLCVLFPLSDVRVTAGRKAWETWASVAFDVYIIHSHILVYDLLLPNRFVWIRALPWYCIPVVCILCGVCIYLICAVLGLLRVRLFRIVRVKELLMELSAGIDGLLYPF